ncbi:MAG: outer membrane protein OmpA-like peptidoglycan-associated protein [Crocinitomicaceae bacterium]|jgi:outer membrane protein OmpA-like peptidoglycan-associated protein
MKVLLIATILLFNATLFAQYETYPGTIQGALSNDGKFRLNSEDTIIFIQGKKVFKTKTRIGRFFLDFEYNLEEPFSIHFTNPYCVRKVAYFDLSSADTSEVIEDGESIIQFPVINMDMVPNYKAEMVQLSVLNFYWGEDQLALDYTHAKDQNEWLDRFAENPKLLFLDSLFDFNSAVFKVGDIYRPTESIRFAKKKGTIDEESQSELDTIAYFLMKNPNIIIEVGAHLDTRAKDVESKRLDKVRANSVKDYLASKGVELAQLKSVGHWKYQPIISESEINSMTSKMEKQAAHEVNRRTEFKVVSVSRRI